MFTGINHTRKEDFSVVWDLGRRCTYECSYCGPHHSNKTSPLVEIDKLKHTLDGIVKYSQLMDLYRKEPLKLDIAYTGGEPTIHPAFFEFVRYAKETYPFIRSNITTNGCYSEKKCREIMDCVNSTTLSYHAEGTPEQKKLVIANIKLMHKSGYNFRINHMFHKDYFDECIELAEWFDELGITYTSRPIGDSTNKSDLLDGTAHEYTEKQLEYFKNQWTKKPKPKPKPKAPSGVMHMLTTEKPKAKTSLETIGRPCCNGKCLSVKVDDKWTKSFRVPSTNFKGWNCMVNWDFLFINSELDGVWHHQTCQVNMDGQIGPIGKASDFAPIIEKLRTTLRSGKMPVIRCPKTHCGCGLCSPKALNDEDAKEIFDGRTQYLEPVFQDGIKDISKDKTVIRLFKEI